MNLIETLNWRYAAKKYSNRKVADDNLQTILEAINLSASSAGMQPYRVYVVDNPELRKKLGEGSFNLQITEASHLLVFAAFENIDQEFISNYIQHTADVRQTPLEHLNDFKASLESHLLNRTKEENFTWAARQAYIALSTGIIAAAHLKIDATPMEGFDNNKFDELLGLKEKGLRSVVLLSIGYRDEEKDIFSKMKKVRVPMDEFVTSLS